MTDRWPGSGWHWRVEKNIKVVAGKSINGLALLFLYFPLRWLLRLFPRKWAMKIGGEAGRWHALLIEDGLLRRAREGIRAVWGEELSVGERNRLLRRNFSARYKHIVEGFFYQDLDERRILRVVPEVEGKEHLDEILAKGQGAILLASHFGSFGLLVAGLCLRGYLLHQIATLTPDADHRSWKWVERAVMALKARCWRHPRVQHLFWRPGSLPRQIYRELRKGAVVVLYGDGSRGQEFTKVSFLGLSMLLSSGPFRIAARVNVPLIPAFVVRQEDESHRVVLEKPIWVDNDSSLSIRQGAKSYATILARYVRAYPDHWLSWARLRATGDEGGQVLELAAGGAGLSDFYTSGSVSTP